jgi:hypothetical protein
METTISVDLEGFKKLTVDFLNNISQCDEDGIQNGLKCLALAYLGLNGSDCDLMIARSYLDFANQKACSLTLSRIRNAIFGVAA